MVGGRQKLLKNIHKSSKYELEGQNIVYYFQQKSGWRDTIKVEVPVGNYIKSKH
ncbi:hypothetical protein NADFUDRAFT_83038 [Nadsonia fulvescens var. elongata DSM 6958]|uniref:Uncharacterized protein n=1 Tax=Nadsonia fulvescens var. elongata DSM 6958 TaxID=857566 RepID=A0A1E3PJ50_9ASCO|nr:hypothetical protein NADFUDRAFT_83038 [Nadsonia fulvescens var. elongata DSM 6958]